jgi:hypothetical protein
MKVRLLLPVLTINPYDFGLPLAEALQDYIKMLGIIDPKDLPAGRIFTQYQYDSPRIDFTGSP